MAVAMAMAGTATVAVGCSKASARTSLFEQHAFVRLLELPAATSSSPFPVLQTNRGPSLESINGIVTPDLPVKASLLEYLHSFDLKHMVSTRNFTSFKEAEKETSADSQPGTSASIQGFDCWQVRTVAAQVRSMFEIQERILKSAHEVEAAGCGGSLLLLSGGHPLRRLWLADHLLPVNSFAMLRAAQHLRKSGLLSPGVQLWSVENPLINPIDRLEKKIEAGAEAVIVQPPLLPQRFEEWWSNAQQRGLTKAVPVIVGLPLLSSSRNYSFWLQLTGASGKDADAIVNHWRKMETTNAGEPRAMETFYYQQSVQLIETIKKMPGVAGIHIMPVTRAGWRQYQKLMAEGRL